MSSRRRTSRISTMLGAVAVAGALTLAPATAAAQEESNAVSATGKGIAGGAMLGAELVMITTAIIGATDWWPYVVFGAVGAGGGAVGGYFVEDAIGEDGAAEPALYMLAGGMALVVPTIVAVLNATAYDPTEDEEEGEEDAPADDDPDATPGVDANVEVETGVRRGVPPALLGLETTERGTRLRLGVPAATIGPRFTAREMATFGVEQGTEVRFPIVRGTF